MDWELVMLWVQNIPVDREDTSEFNVGESYEDIIDSSGFNITTAQVVRA